MARFRLASVLRARQVQEDAARGAVMQARAEVATAAAEAVRRERVLAATSAPTGVTAAAFIAAACARQGLAAELTMAKTMVAQAEQGVTDRLGEYTAASIRRRGVEKMSERHAAAARAAEEAALQRELDDLPRPTDRRPSPWPRPTDA